MTAGRHKQARGQRLCKDGVRGRARGWDVQPGWRCASSIVDFTKQAACQACCSSRLEAVQRHRQISQPPTTQPSRAPVELCSILTLSSLEAGVGDQERGLVSWLSSATASGPRGEPGWLSPAGS